MKNNPVKLLLLLVATICIAGFANAGTCVDGGCHSDKVAYKYLHGPLAAEELGMNGCTSCHIPQGANCTKDKAGEYKFVAKEDNICSTCHEKSTATDHLNRNDGCLDCHSPHGSEVDATLQR